MTSIKLVRGGTVLPGATGVPLCNGGVLVQDAVIEAVGDFETLRRQHPMAEVVGSGAMAVLPGLINAHHHSHATTTIQHGISDDLLEPWILSFAPMRRTDVYLNTLLSCARQLRSGVTTVVDVHSTGGDAGRFASSVDAGLRAYDHAGMRVAFAAGQTMQSFLVHGDGEDRAFLESLPGALRQRTESLLLARDCITVDEYLDVMEQRIRDYAAHSRIYVWFGPPGPQWVPERLLQDIAERARSLDTGIQTHCVESHYEMLHGFRSYAKPTVEHLRDLGILSERFSVAHGVWLTEPELEILAETGAAVSHNPSSNLRLRTGIAPLNAMLSSGMTVGLGMDGTTLNEDEDMFTEMRLAMRLQRTPFLSGPAPSPEDVFALATTGGARLMRKHDVLGRIEPGYRADLMLLDMTRVCWPWVAPEADPRELLLMQARAGDVDTVLIDGEVVLEGGLPTRIDIEEVARALADDLASKGYDQARAELVAELKPRLEDWYRRWEQRAPEPYVAYNSRR